MDINYLKENVGWVLLTFEDTSQKKIITTMNREILESFEITEIRENELYDLQRKQWVSIDSVMRADIFEEEPELTHPLDKFMEGFLCK